MVSSFSKIALAVAMLSLSAEAVAPTKVAPMEAKTAISSPKLRGLNASSVEIPQALIGTKKMPCQCELANPKWTKCARTVPRCVFIDLGAADGNSFAHFLKDGYGPLGQCPSVDWHAMLVEANPRFDKQLGDIGKQHNGKIDVMSSTAAYMCEAETSFYLDTVNTEKNFWGSSMNENAPDAVASGKQKVTVPTSNLNRILFENTIPGDWVMLKMDIEGSEYDVIPCLADSDSASLVDRLYLEEHGHLPVASHGMAGTTPQAFAASKDKLKAKGVDIPDYFSYTL